MECIGTPRVGGGGDVTKRVQRVRTPHKTLHCFLGYVRCNNNNRTTNIAKITKIGQSKKKKISMSFGDFRTYHDGCFYSSFFVVIRLIILYIIGLF